MKPHKKKTWKEGDRSKRKLRAIRFSLDLDAKVTKAMEQLDLDRTALIRRAILELLARLESEHDKKVDDRIENHKDHDE